MGVHDLNFGLNIFCDTSGFTESGVTHERGQDAVCASHGVCAVEDLWAHRRPPRRRCRSTHSELRRLVPRDGFLAIDMARVFARHRGLPDIQSIQAVSYGFEWRACTLHAFGRTESAELAHLSCAGNAPDCPRPRPLHQRADRPYARCNGLRAGPSTCV
jgi:hypothetical protein